MLPLHMENRSSKTKRTWTNEAPQSTPSCSTLATMVTVTMSGFFLKMAAPKHMPTSTSGFSSFLGFLMVSVAVVRTSLAQFGAPDVSNGRGNVVVVWEVFLDPLCRSCKAGWPALTQVAQRYGVESLTVVVHPFPAPFHHNAFFAARALHIAQMTNASLVYPLLELVFRNQETFSNPSTKYETPAHVISRLIALTGELGVPASAFESGFNDSATDEATRVSFKYGCSKGVVHTPTYLVNGVTVAANDRWSVDDWAKIFDPIVKETGFNGRTYHSSQS